MLIWNPHPRQKKNKQGSKTSVSSLGADDFFSTTDQSSKTSFNLWSSLILPHSKQTPLCGIFECMILNSNTEGMYHFYTADCNTTERDDCRFCFVV